jgi:hypothetical protein
MLLRNGRLDLLLLLLLLREREIDCFVWWLCDAIGVVTTAALNAGPNKRRIVAMSYGSESERVRERERARPSSDATQGR